MNGYFITGTDTNVGKTYCTCLLLQHLVQSSGETARVSGFKPFCSGPREDAEHIREWSQPTPELDLINPCWFPLPTAPLVAHSPEAYPLQLKALWVAWEKLCAEYDTVLVEGAGGWLTPLLPDMRVADLAKALSLPVLVVASNRLGVLNHTLLTVERILADGLVCAGVILNNLSATFPEDEAPARDTNAGMLRQLLPADVPLLAELKPGQDELKLDLRRRTTSP